MTIKGVDKSGETDNSYNDYNITASNNNIIVFHQKAKTNLISRFVPKISGKEKQTCVLTKSEYNKAGKISTSAGDSKIGWIALTGFLCSVMGLVFSFTVFTALLGLPGIIFSAIALKKYIDGDKLNRSLSLAGLIIGIIDILIILLMFVIVFLLLAAM